jgi:peptidoglycan/LPS O-acetylase OafA/YrhL
MDGLRGVAVLAVVLFHLGAGGAAGFIPGGFIPGGFAGVDVFFVISGYLIASQLYAEAETGSFSLLRFYERRARRILPALLATLVASSAAAALLFYPRELVAFTTSAIAAALFCANLHFQAMGDYFAPAADTVPLLHLWSLGIEEQFYIAFPLLLAAVMKLNRRSRDAASRAPISAPLGAALAFLLVVSVAASQALIAASPGAAFFSAPSRAFELLIGCMLALPRVPSPSALGARLASLAGAGCLAGTFALFDRSTPFPGLFALVPCLATAAIIWSGGAAAPAPVSRLLALRPLVLIGRLSYSLYLVHWPVLVFGKRLLPHAEPMSFAVGAALVSLALAIVSYQLVEQPFRRRGEARPAGRGLVAAATAMAAVVVLGAITVQQSGFAGSADNPRARVLAHLQFDPRPLYRSRECFLDPDQDLTSIDVKRCLPDGSGKAAMLWGDSHAADLYPGLKIAFADAGYSLGELTASACGPLVGRDAPARPKCRLFNDQVLALLLTLKPTMVILAAEWFPDPDAVKLLDQTVTVLSNGGSKVIILGNSPLFKASVPNLIADRMPSGAENSMNGLTTGLSSDLASVQDVELNFEHAADGVMSTDFAGRPDVRYVSIFETVCPNSRCPLLANDETPIYFDASHLTGAGSLMFAKVLTPQILR